MHCYEKNHLKSPSVYNCYGPKPYHVWWSLPFVCRWAVALLYLFRADSCFPEVPCLSSSSHHQSSLIPFGAIILSQLLNGRDTITPPPHPPPNRTQSNWLANLRESPTEPHWRLVPAKKKLAKVWPYECLCGLEWVSRRSDRVGIRHTKGGHSTKYCCEQKQTVVKTPALFRCLVLSYPLLSWPFPPCSLSVSIHHSPTQTKSHTEKPKLMTISLLPEECSYLCMFCPYLLFQYHRNQRNQGPLWWRLGAALLSLLFDRGFIAGGGGAGRRWGGGVFSSHLFSSSLWGTGLLMALSNLTRVCFCGGGRKETKSRRGTETTNFYTRSCVSFISKKMPWCSEIPRQDNVHILV